MLVTCSLARELVKLAQKLFMTNNGKENGVGLVAQVCSTISGHSVAGLGNILHGRWLCYLSPHSIGVLHIRMEQQRLLSTGCQDDMSLLWPGFYRASP